MLATCFFFRFQLSLPTKIIHSKWLTFNLSFSIFAIFVTSSWFTHFLKSRFWHSLLLSLSLSLILSYSLSLSPHANNISLSRFICKFIQIPASFRLFLSLSSLFYLIVLLHFYLNSLIILSIPVFLFNFPLSFSITFQRSVWVQSFAFSATLDCCKRNALSSNSF